jgi:hypothetical protein
MKSPVVAAAAGLFVLFAVVSQPGYAQQPAQDHQHDQQAPAAQTAPGQQPHQMPAHDMAAMKAADARIAALAEKMKTSTGAARIDAMAELLTALVEHHQTMCAAMMNHK